MNEYNYTIEDVYKELIKVMKDDKDYPINSHEAIKIAIKSRKENKPFKEVNVDTLEKDNKTYWVIQINDYRYLVDVITGECINEGGV